MKLFEKEVEVLKEKLAFSISYFLHSLYSLLYYFLLKNFELNIINKNINKQIRTNGTDIEYYILIH